MSYGKRGQHFLGKNLCRVAVFLCPLAVMVKLIRLLFLPILFTRTFIYVVFNLWHYKDHKRQHGEGLPPSSPLPTC